MIKESFHQEDTIISILYVLNTTATKRKKEKKMVRLKRKIDQPQS